MLAVHEMTRAALRQSVATEAITVSGQPLQMAANPESISAPATGLDIAAIHDVLTTIYEEQERAASIIPTD